MRRTTGFTLIELLVVVALVGVLLAIAAPNLAPVLANNRITSASSDLLIDLTFARATAASRSQRVGICASTNQTACTAATTWAQGRIIYVDVDANQTFSAGDSIVRVRDALPDGITLVPSGGQANIFFRPSGPAGPATTNTFTICKPAYKGRDIAISATGRVASTTHTSNCP